MTIDPTRLCQFEIPVTDVGRAVEFYTKAFGWAPVPAELHEYVILTVPTQCSFGISLVPQRLAEGGSARSGPSVVPYFASDDPEAVAEAVVRFGGRRRFGPTNLAGYGRVYQVEDPDGNRFGLYHAPTPGAELSVPKSTATPPAGQPG